jgi:hypothetical protein
VASLCALLPAARVALRLRVALNASVVAAPCLRERSPLKSAGRESKRNPFFQAQKSQGSIRPNHLLRINPESSVHQ